MGSLNGRARALEEYVERQVEERLEAELTTAFDRLEQHLTREEFIRVAQILADGEQTEHRTEGARAWPKTAGRHSR